MIRDGFFNFLPSTHFGPHIRATNSLFLICAKNAFAIRLKFSHSTGFAKKFVKKEMINRKFKSLKSFRRIAQDSVRKTGINGDTDLRPNPLYITLCDGETFTLCNEALKLAVI